MDVPGKKVLLGAGSVLLVLSVVSVRLLVGLLKALTARAYNCFICPFTKQFGINIAVYTYYSNRKTGAWWASVFAALSGIGGITINNR
jgi:hypothetical protein